jgi:hypothetical protein
MDLVTEGMEVLQDCVRSGRKLKNSAGVSFKERPFLVRFKIPFAIMFSINRNDTSEIVRRMLKADAVYFEEEGFDSPFELSDESDKFENFSGYVESGKVKAQLWTKEQIWN